MCNIDGVGDITVSIPIGENKIDGVGDVPVSNPTVECNNDGLGDVPVSNPIHMLENIWVLECAN